jgi:hypothetical protein
MKKAIVSFAAIAAAALVFGAAASAHGEYGGVGRVSTSRLVTTAASQLNVSRARLVTAIRSSAYASIDQAVEDEDITADEADEYTEEVVDNLSFAYRLSRASTVASNLGISTSALNGGFRAARKAILNAQIDAALAAGRISADEAAELKEQVAALTAGYKAGGVGGGLGVGCGHRGS